MLERIRHNPASNSSLDLWPPMGFMVRNWRVCLTCGGLGLTLLIFILAGALATFPGDRAASEAFHQNQSDWLNSAALAVSTLGGKSVAGALMIGLITLLVLTRRRADVLVVFLGAAPILAGIFLKEAVGRARPDYLIIGSEPTSLSFPSGHALFAMVFGGLLIVLASDIIRPVKIRRPIQIGLALLILAIGASRVYLGVHFPSDVLGGYLFGAMALLGLVWLRNRLSNRGAEMAPTIG